MPRPATVLTAVAIASAVAAAAPASAGAAAAAQREVCAARATLYESPRGIAVATVLRGESVLVLRWTPRRDHARVATSFGSRGWIRARDLCRSRA